MASPLAKTHRWQEIVVLTGAGISAESGVATFRDRDGIWSKVNVSDVATPEGFARDPARVHAFYNTRRRDHAGIRPNAAHHALAVLEQTLPVRVTVVTQNIDALHEQAGTRSLIHMHGELLRALWGPAQEHETHYLRIYVGHVRHKLGDDPMNPRYIENEPGVGYRFLTPDC